MKPIRFSLVAALILTAALWLGATAFAEETFPKPGWKERPSPLADPLARVGGEMSIFAGPSPKSLNYYLDNNSFTAQAFGAMYETLLGDDPVTMEYIPNLAEKWTISDDKKVFTFYIDKSAKWSDGEPITAHDVRWTYDAILDEKNLTGPFKIFMERFLPPEVLDDHTIRFTAKTVHWQNLSAIGGTLILPKHAFEHRDFNKINFEFPVVSGLYRVGEIQEGVYVTLVRRDDWWQKDRPGSQGVGNFQTLRFRFFAERENAFEAFKKGLIDLFPVYTARIWMNETGGKRFANNWILKQKIYNFHPIGFQGFAMNMRRPPFDDAKVREAAAFLLDRKKMNSVLMYDQYFLHRSYFEDLYGPEHPNPNPEIEFDKEKARALLKDAGWKVNPATGYLEKDGRTLTFSFLTRSATADKFLAIYAEDLKDVGIRLEQDKKDWAAWARDMDGFNFDMTWAAWSSGVRKDPEGMWSSSEADRTGGNNITGFKNKVVDDLIEKQKSIFDIQIRNDICREIDGIVYRDFPYVLLWNIDYVRLLYWNKFGIPGTVLSKYGDESSAYWYWWADPDTAAELEDAMAEELPLAAKPPVVRFTEQFHE